MHSREKKYSSNLRRCLSTSTCLSVALLISCFASLAVAASENASPSADTRARDDLFHQSLKHPSDVALAMAYAKACIELKDYEGAIGSLERILYYVPNDKAVKAQLGLLYEQLGSHQMGKLYLDEASSGEALDPALKAKVQETKATADDAVRGQRFFGSFQAGARYQTNAAFNPENNILRLSSQDYVLTHPFDRGSDGNAFQLAEIGYDYDLGNQRGDLVEARIVGYATQQFKFTDLNVGLYDVSVGPRFFLGAGLPGWSFKPYAAGGQVFLAGQRYVASGGAGIIADMPVAPSLLLQPGAEIRRVSFSNVSVFSSLNSGDTATASLAATATVTPWLSLTGRFYYARNFAEADYQSLNTYAEEFALVAQLPTPLLGASPAWSVSPYVKLLQSRFDAPNPFIDATTRRRDAETQVGIALDTPINARFDVVSNLQYAQVSSTIPNYRLRNFSILSGPRIKF